MTLAEIVTQLRACNYECEAGPLENNTAFQELVRLANEIDGAQTYDIYYRPADRKVTRLPQMRA